MSSIQEAREIQRCLYLHAAAALGIICATVVTVLVLFIITVTRQPTEEHILAAPADAALGLVQLLGGCGSDRRSSVVVDTVQCFHLRRVDARERHKGGVDGERRL